MTENFFHGKIVSVVKRDEYSEFLMKVSTVCTKVLLLIHVLKFIKLRNQKKNKHYNLTLQVLAFNKRHPPRNSKRIPTSITNVRIF